MSRTISSAFFDKMQGDGLDMALVIDLETEGPHFHWTSANNQFTYTLSSVPTVYYPFPGQTLNGLTTRNDLSISVIDFMVANTGGIVPELLETTDLDYATLKIGRVFTDTPDLGRMEIFQGNLGDYSYNRQAISGSVRNNWGSRNDRFPYYNYQDNCIWRFGSAGCGIDTSSYTLAFSVGNVNASSTNLIDITLVSTTLVQSYSNGRFDFGRLTVTGGPNSGHIRTIRSHTGDLLRLSHALPINDLSTFDFSIFPGCRKRFLNDCVSIYNNAANFVGFPWIPIQEDAF